MVIYRVAVASLKMGKWRELFSKPLDKMLFVTIMVTYTKDL